MATISHDRRDVVVEPPPAVPAEAAASSGGDPASLGLPIFVVGSVALGLSLVGYVPASAGGAIVPIIFAGTGLGLVISTIWAAALGQTMVASIFGLFAGFWLSFATLLLALDHNWLLVPSANVTHSVALFLISWAVILAFLTVALIRLPLAFPLLIGLVVLALVLKTLAVLDNSAGLNHVAGVVVFVFAAIGGYLFIGVADAATGGKGLPLGPALRR